MQIKNILVPIDFSACSKNALKQAISFAKKTNAKIHMVNAVHLHTPHANYTSAAILDTLFEDVDTQVKQSYEELASEIIELKDIPHETDRFISFLTDAIQAEIRNKDIDLIIMGTREKHDGVDQFIGTNSTDVINSTRTPVLVVPEKQKIYDIKKIAFAADLKKISNLGNISVLSAFAEIYGAEILVFHVEKDPVQISSEEEKMIHAISEKLENVSSSVRTAIADEVETGIKDFIRQHDIDLLAMIPRRHNLFEKLFNKSMTRSIAIDPETPLLAFHDL